ncbi:hypothetical protein GCM10023147_13000 [Tsukamurella soli]|uniref:Uncharacterized protein n=1 Tax=Tsukamurella soli TaxID=644556 RepID=A0ABP8JB58_9ACTN
MRIAGSDQTDLWTDLWSMCGEHAAAMGTPVWTIGENLWTDRRILKSSQVKAISEMWTSVE